LHRRRLESIGRWICAALALYVSWLGVAYYFHIDGIARHHLETIWFWFAAAAAGMALISPARRAAAEQTTALPAWSTAVLLVAFAIAAIAIDFPALRLGFLSDDFVFAGIASRGERVGPAWSFVRPLPTLLFRLFAGRPAGLHVVLVLLHAANAALIVQLATALELPPRTAIAAGLLFLTFPAHVEAIAWCSGIQDALMTAGVLVAIVSVGQSRPASAAGGFAAALLSKETAVAAPVLGALAIPKRWRVWLIGLVIAGSYTIWHVVAVPVAQGYAVAPSRYSLKELIVRPYATLAVPVRSSTLAHRPWLGALAVALLAALVIRAATAWRGDRQALLRVASCVAWILAATAPVYSMFDITGTLEGSRYAYLPAAGWSVLLASMMLATAARANLVLVAAACAIGIAGVRTNLGPWTLAAQARDRVIASVERARESGCLAVWVEQPPDSIEGAYVFRNGLAEAVAPASLSPDAPAACRVALPH